VATVLLLGMEDHAAQAMGRIIRQDGHTVSRELFKIDFPSRPSADLIFLCGDHPDYLAALRAIRAYACAPPVIVVTRLPEASRWIDALEAGAADYCAEPFERSSVRWMLDPILGRPKAMAA
jgi:DNA-binding response OmpR family regulator